MVSGRVKNAVRRLGVEPQYPPDDFWKVWRCVDGQWVQVDSIEEMKRESEEYHKQLAEEQKNCPPPWFDPMNRSGKWKDAY